MPVVDRRKRFGAYYTPKELAFQLARWAIRTPRDRVLDPAFGNGVFLEACIERLREIGGKPRRSIHGVEIDAKVHHAVTARLHRRRPGCSKDRLLRNDFFDLEREALPAFEAVVGNPPYVRYQLFTGVRRSKALDRALQHDVKLSALSSAWAPFVVHACSFLDRNGRAALVLPSELVNAQYARPVLEFFQREFRKTTIIRTTGDRPFPELSLDTVFVLAEGYGHRGRGLTLTLVPTIGAMGGLLQGQRRVNGVAKRHRYDAANPFALSLVEPAVRELLSVIDASAQTARLGDVSDVNIGYVTGASDFFHLSRVQVKELNLPDAWLRPVVRKSRFVTGLRFTTGDWRGLEATETSYLLHRPDYFCHVPGAVKRLLDSEAGREASRAWQCRRREPWWNIRIGERPDLFLLYSPALGPRLVANTANCWASNSVHVCHLSRGFKPRGREIALSWLSTFTQLSAEFQSRVMGNGLRKLDPTAAESTSLVLAPGAHRVLDPRQLDRLLREGKREIVRAQVDHLFLTKELGLSARDQVRLRRALERLRAARY